MKEHWGALEQNIGSDLERMNKWDYDCDTVADANKEGAGIGVETLKSTDYYKDALSFGRNCQKNYVDWKWNHGMSFDLLGVDKDKAYNIKAKNNQLPFDFYGNGSIDLVVARREVNTPFALLDDFDLTICKASFNGKNFCIPDPHLTFSRKSTMETHRRAVVESYVKHYNPPSTRYLMGIDASSKALSTIKKVRKDVPSGPFYKQLDISARLPDRYDSDSMFGDGSMYDPFVQVSSMSSPFEYYITTYFSINLRIISSQAKHSAPCMFHNWICKLIWRLQKYQARGIDVIGAPAIGDDFEIHEFALISHGG